MARSYSLLIADDQVRTRQSLRAWLSAELPLAPVFEAANGQEAIQYVARYLPDLVLMDAKMEPLDGIEATRQIKQRYPQVMVVVLSLYPSYQADAFAAGADAFVAKDEQPEHLLAALTALLS